MLRPVLQYPDPRLAQKSAEVTEINDEIRALAQDMLDTLKAIGGVGIAAPQIGIFKRVIILDLSQELKDPDAPQEFKALVNPRVTVLDPALHAENEGCLSVPDYRAMVKRPRRVALDALDLDGNPVPCTTRKGASHAEKNGKSPWASGGRTVFRASPPPDVFSPFPADTGNAGIRGSVRRRCSPSERLRINAWISSDWNTSAPSLKRVR